MHSQVAAAFRRFTEPLEGYVSSMYVDVKGLITTGCGNLIDPEPAALQLPWKHADGVRATQQEVSAAWHALKAQKEHFKKLHWKFAAQLNDLRLSAADIDELVVSRLKQFEDHLRRNHFAAWDKFPADAQLGILSMAWAMGPGFPNTFVNFKRAVWVKDWRLAAASCAINTTGNPGVVPRNAHNKLCFINAAIVTDTGWDLDVLHWPNLIPPTTSVVDHPASREMLVAHAEAGHELDRFVREEFERVRAGLSSGAALRQYEETP